MDINPAERSLVAGWRYFGKFDTSSRMEKNGMTLRMSASITVEGFLVWQICYIYATRHMVKPGYQC
jgi:hypothetical protein